MAITLCLLRREIGLRLRFFLAAVLLLGNVLVVLPWTLWVYFKTDKVVLISGGGAPSIRDGLTFAVSGGFRKTGGLPEDVMALMRNLSVRYDEMESLPGIMSVVGEEFRKNPVAVAKLCIIKALLSWYATHRRRFDTATMLVQIPYLLLMLWGSFATYKQGGIARQMTVGIWLILLYFWGMSILVLPVLRYMVPAIGLLFVLIPGSFFTARVAETTPLQEENIS